VLKRLSGPVRRYFNSRFSAIHQSVVQGNTDDHALLAATLASVTAVSSRVDGLGGATEAATQQILAATGHANEDLHQTLMMIGRNIDELGQKIDAALDRGPASPEAAGGTTSVAERLDHLARRVGLLTFDAGHQGALAQLSEYEATVADYAHAHNGWAAQAGLWFNPPISVRHAAGGVSLARVNERIAEVPFVFRQLTGLPSGSRVLDIGSTESAVALSLASLGYDVTAVDPRPYPLSHPQLRTFHGGIENFADEHPFDAVILLSSIQHVGTGAYGLKAADDADLAAMARVRQLTRPGTRLVLTAPYGEEATTALQRIYTVERLDKLLEGWHVDERSYLTRESATEWRWHTDTPSRDGEHIVLVAAIREGGPA
jgi:SAM-dependent methyltransferase